MNTPYYAIKTPAGWRFTRLAQAALLIARAHKQTEVEYWIAGSRCIYTLEDLKTTIKYNKLYGIEEVVKQTNPFLALLHTSSKERR